jgi:hypothetical protein
MKGVSYFFVPRRIFPWQKVECLRISANEIFLSYIVIPIWWKNTMWARCDSHYETLSRHTTRNGGDVVHYPYLNIAVCVLINVFIMKKVSWNLCRVFGEKILMLRNYANHFLSGPSSIVYPNYLNTTQLCLLTTESETCCQWIWLAVDLNQSYLYYRLPKILFVFKKAYFSKTIDFSKLIFSVIFTFFLR